MTSITINEFFIYFVAVELVYLSTTSTIKKNSNIRGCGFILTILGYRQRLLQIFIKPAWILNCLLLEEAESKN